MNNQNAKRHVVFATQNFVVTFDKSDNNKRRKKCRQAGEDLIKEYFIEPMMDLGDTDPVVAYEQELRYIGFLLGEINCTRALMFATDKHGELICLVPESKRGIKTISNLKGKSNTLVTKVEVENDPKVALEKMTQLAGGNLEL